MQINQYILSVLPSCGITENNCTGEFAYIFYKIDFTP